MWLLNGGGILASSLWPCSSPDKSSLPFQKLRTCMVLTRPVEWQKGKKKHFIKLCLLYNIAFWKILNPLFTLMENWEKDWFCHRETYIKPLWTKFIGVIVHHRIKVYWSSINVYVPPSLDLKSYNDQYIAWNKKLQSLLHQICTKKHTKINIFNINNSVL